MIRHLPSHLLLPMLSQRPRRGVEPGWNLAEAGAAPAG
jgi:hypothetical protein